MARKLRQNSTVVRGRLCAPILMSAGLRRRGSCSGAPSDPRAFLLAFNFERVPELGGNAGPCSPPRARCRTARPGPLRATRTSQTTTGRRTGATVAMGGETTGMTRTAVGLAQSAVGAVAGTEEVATERLGMGATVSETRGTTATGAARTSASRRTAKDEATGTSASASRGTRATQGMGTGDGAAAVARGAGMTATETTAIGGEVRQPAPASRCRLHA